MIQKLLFIVPIFPKSKEDDTIVPFIAQFCMFFSEQYPEVDIHILTLHYPEIQEPYQIDCLKIFPLNHTKKGKLSTIKTIISGIQKSRKLYKQHKYNGVLSFWYGPTAVIGNQIKKKYSIPHYTWMQGQDIKPSNTYLKFFKPNPDTLISVGANHNSLLQQYQGYKAKTVANVAVNPQTFPSLNTEKRSMDIIGIGNLGALKNYSLFIDIIAELKSAFPTIKAAICGDGEERALLLQKIYSLNLEENIKLFGYVPNQKARDLLNNSKILLHTSTFEGNSMVVQEALYSGCIVVSTISLQKEVHNFYFKSKKEQIVDQLKTLLAAQQNAIKRVQPFKIEDTARTIYDCFWASK